MRRKRIQIAGLVIVIVMMSVVTFKAWIESGPWFLPPAFAVMFGVIAVLVVAARAQSRMNDMQRDPDARPCPICEYDLRGNISGRCPECGKRTEALSLS